MTRKKPTTDALAILKRRLYADPARQAGLEQARAHAAVARQILALRLAANLTQRELAKRVGTTASVFCRLEDADYEGHSMAMLTRIAAALDHRVEIAFVPGVTSRV